MSFRITGLDPAPFVHLYGLSDDALEAEGAKRCVADARPGYPDRVGMRDAELGESLLLVNFTHQPADTPYRSSHAIFVLEGAEDRYDRIDEVPEVMRTRPLSIRAFDESGMMLDADLIDGREAAASFERLLAAPGVAYLHAHNARRGCFSGRVERAS